MRGTCWVLCVDGGDGYHTQSVFTEPAAAETMKSAMEALFPEERFAIYPYELNPKPLPEPDGNRWWIVDHGVFGDPPTEDDVRLLEAFWDVDEDVMYRGKAVMVARCGHIGKEQDYQTAVLAKDQRDALARWSERRNDDD